MLAVTVILLQVPSSLCSALLVTLHLLPSSRPPHSEWCPRTLHLPGDNVQTAASDFASFILSSVFPLPLHLYPFDAARLFKKAQKMFHRNWLLYLFIFFLMQVHVTKGVNYIVKSAVRKLNPLAGAHHLRTLSHAIHFCQTFLYLFICLSLKPNGRWGASPCI